MIYNNIKCYHFKHPCSFNWFNSPWLVHYHRPLLWCCRFDQRCAVSVLACCMPTLCPHRVPQSCMASIQWRENDQLPLRHHQEAQPATSAATMKAEKHKSTIPNDCNTFIQKCTETDPKQLIRLQLHLKHTDTFLDIRNIQKCGKVMAQFFFFFFTNCNLQLKQRQDFLCLPWF